MIHHCNEQVKEDNDVDYGEGENDDHPVSTTSSRYWGEYKTPIIPCPTELSECDKT